MNEKLIKTLKEVFGGQQKSTKELIQLSQVKGIDGLVTLITSLDKKGEAPKIIAQNIEDVIVCISLKEKPTELEEKLHHVLENFQPNEDLEKTNNFNF